LADVASVAGRAISQTRLEERVARFRRGPGGRHVPPDADGAGALTLRRWLLQDLVTEAVLAHEVEGAGLGGSREAMPEGGADSIDPDLIRRLCERVTADVDVSEGEVRAYYDRNLDRYRRPEARVIRQLIAANESLARELVPRLEASPRMDLHRGEFTGPLEDAVFEAAPGDVLGPIRSEHGWHVVRLDAVLAEHTTPYAEVRGAIEAELVAAARGKAFAAWLERRRREIVVIEPGWEHPADPVHGVVAHRH
jgi:[acyl-carrier-protein] S-malonyltransferase